MSSVPQSKAELLTAINTAYAKLVADYQRIPVAYTRELALEGNSKGTLISVCDTLAYLIGWGKLVCHWHEAKQQGQAVDFPATGYQWHQLGPLAASFHQAYASHEYEILLAEYDVIIKQILAIVDASSDEALYHTPWYEKWPLGRMIQFNTSSPMKNVRIKVRRFAKAQGFK